MALDLTYNWNFNPLECYPTESGQTDVVFNVHWQLYASTGSYGASSYGVQSVGPLGSGSFTPFEDLTKEQQTLFNHCVDLDRKMGSAQFNLDQLAVGKEAFIKRLEESLAEKPEVTQ